MPRLAETACLIASVNQLHGVGWLNANLEQPLLERLLCSGATLAHQKSLGAKIGRLDTKLGGEAMPESGDGDKLVV